MHACLSGLFHCHRQLGPGQGEHSGKHSEPLTFAALLEEAVLAFYA